MRLSEWVPWKRLEQRSALIFFVAGICWFGMAAVAFYENRFLGDPNAFIWLTDPLLLLGAIGAMVGLLGFYPQLRDSAPRVTGATAIVVALGVLSWIAYTGGNAIEWAFVQSGSFGSTTTAADFFWVGVLLSIMLGFLLFSLVSLWRDENLRVEGVLMLLPFLAILLHAIAGNFVEMPDPILMEWAVMGLVMIGLSYRLRFYQTPAGATSSVTKHAND